MCFDRYFEYLKNIQHELTEPLASFALDPERYELNGNNTLHDGWLLSLTMSKTIDSEFIVCTSIDISLLQAMHEKVIHLSYFDVKAVSYIPQLGDDTNHFVDASLPADLFIHEFSKMDNNVFRHYIEFSDGSYIDIYFSSFAYKETKWTP
jgi:hypothetical protein